MLNRVPRWFWLLIPFAIVAGAALVINSSNRVSALFDALWVVSTIGVLVYIIYSARKTEQKPPEN